jgi:glucokinase
MTTADTLYIGLDVGRTIRGALIDGAGNIRCQQQIVSEVRDPRVFVDQLIDTINALKSSPDADRPVKAVGIGWPGMVDVHTNRPERAVNLLDVSSLDLHRELKEGTGLPVAFDNDANAGAYGERCCGAGRGCRDMFYITMGTGIGAGLILNGQLHRGCRGYAGEFGHVPIDMTGLQCACGSIGCLETVASGPNIVRRVRERLFTDPAFSVSPLAQDMEGTLTFHRIVQAALEHDKLAQSVLRRTCAFLGASVAGIINLLNVEMVVFGGSMMAAGDIILEPIREEARKRTMPLAFDCCRIVVAQLGKDSGLIGAAMLARDAQGIEAG